MFVTNHAALKIRDCLVMADLHMGAEYEIMKSGIWVRQVDDLIERTLDLLKITKARKVILLGDVKHNVPFMKRVEEVSVPMYLEKISKKAKITVIPGNHDGGIAEICPHNIEIAESGGIRIGKYGLLHGQANMSRELEKAETLIIGHNHPMFMFEDAGGARFYRQVWIKGVMKNGQELTIMPAFSRLVGGAAVNKLKSGKELMGPIAKQLDLKTAEIYLTDGTLIGRFKDVSK